LTDKSGAAPYRAAALMSHKHDCCEVISGISLPLLEVMYPQRETLSSAEFRQAIVAQGVRASAACGISSRKSSFRPAHDPV
jgi:PTS system ascorbate-specific IIA component